MHLGPRTRSSQVSLWNLPEELILYILKGLPIRDLLSMRAVSTWSKFLHLSLWEENIHDLFAKFFTYGIQSLIIEYDL